MKWNSKRKTTRPFSSTRYLRRSGTFLGAACRLQTFRHWSQCAISPQFSATSRHWPRQGKDPIISWLYKAKPLVWLRIFDPQAFGRLDILLLVDQITDVQHPLHDIDTEFTTELEASFRQYGFSSSTVLISVPFVPTVVEEFWATGIVNTEDGWRMLLDTWELMVLDSMHRLNSSASLKYSGDMAAEWTQGKNGWHMSTKTVTHCYSRARSS